MKKTKKIIIFVVSITIIMLSLSISGVITKGKRGINPSLSFAKAQDTSSITVREKSDAENSIIYLGTDNGIDFSKTERVNNNQEVKFDKEFKFYLEFTQMLALDCDGNNKPYVLTSFINKNTVSALEIELKLSNNLLGEDSIIVGIDSFTELGVFEAGGTVLKTLDISETSIETIGVNSFIENRYLRQVLLPKTLKVIKEKAFKGCDLNNLTIGDEVLSIEDEAFANNTNLIVVRGGLKLNYVGNRAFSNTKLKWFQLKNADMANWGEDVFDQSNSVKLFHNSSVKGWGNCKGLAKNGEWVTSEDKVLWKLNIDDSRILDFTKNIENETIETKDEYGIKYTLSKVSNTFEATITGYDGNETELYVPSNVIYDSVDNIKVKAIGVTEQNNNGVFENDQNLKQVTFLENTITAESSGTKIGANTFKNCKNLEKVYIKDGYTFIGNNAFAGCSSLSYIVIGKDVQTIESSAFANCGSNNTTVFVKTKELETIKDAINKLTEQNAKIVFTQVDKNKISEKYYTNYELDSNNNDKQGIFYQFVELNGEDGNKTIVAYVGDKISEDSDDERAYTSRYSGSDFYSGEIGHAVIPDYVSIQGEDECYKVTALGRYSFYNCSSLAILEIGAHIETIYDCSIRNCQSLIKFIVDSKNNNFATENVDLTNNQASSAANEGKLLFSINKIENTITFDQLKKASLDFERFDENYFGSAKATIIAQGLSSIENYAFANCIALTLFDFKYFNKISFIGSHAFENTNLSEVDLQYADLLNQDIYVGNEAFANCYFLKTVKIGKLVWFQDVKYVKGKKRAETSEINTKKPLYMNPFLHCTSLEKFESTSDKYVVVDDVLYLNKDNTYAILLQYPAARLNSNLDVRKHFEINNVKIKSNLIPVRGINAYAFSSAIYLENVEVSDEVYYIGKAAFENCVRLSNINIGKNVLYIGMEIPDITQDVENEIIQSGERQNIIKNIYEQEVFQNCYVLNNIKINEDNKYYSSDTNGILYDKEKTIIMVYGQGITRITFNIPATVTKIAMESFQYNTHIQRINIPENVTEIGAKAFNGCTNLSFIYFRSIYAPKIEEQVFNSTGSYNGGLHLYCIPEPEVWLSNYSFLWEKYIEELEKYNSIEEIPNQTQPTNDVYLIYVIDADGNGLTDIHVEYNYEKEGLISRNSILTNEYGYAILSLPYDLDPAILTLLHIYDSNNVFFDYNLENYALDYNIGYSYITLYAVPSFEGVSMYANNEFGQTIYSEDISSKMATINTAYLGFVNPLESFKQGTMIIDLQGKKLTISAMGSWDSKSKLTNLVLYRTKEDAEKNNLARIVSNGELVNQSTKLYSFIIEGDDLKQFEDGSNELWLRADIKYGENGKKEIVVKLNIKIYYYDLYDDFNFSFWNGSLSASANGIKFDSSIPFLGDSFLKISDNSNPFNFIKFTPDKIILSAGFSDSDLDKQSIWSVLSSQVSKKNRKETLNSFEDLATAIKECQNRKLKELLVESQLKNEIHMQFAGTIELSRLDNGLLAVTKKNITGSIGYKFMWQKTWIVFYIPITVSIEASAEGSFEWTISYDYELENLFNGGPLIDRDHTIEFGLKLKLDVSAGIGCTLASVGIYGSAGLDLFMKLDDTFSFDKNKSVLKLDIGFYLKVDLGLFKLSKKWSALDWFGVSGEIYIFGKPDEASEASTYTVVSEDLEQLSPDFITFNESLVYAISEISQTSTFQECDYSDYQMYGGVNPEIITYANTTYLFYIENVLLNADDCIIDHSWNADKTILTMNNVTYNSYNYLKLVYRIRDNNKNEWSKYYIVNNNGQNDTGFAYASSNDLGINLLVRSMGGIITPENANNYTDNIVLTAIDLIKSSSGNFSTYVTKLYDMSTYNVDSPLKGYVYNMSVEILDGKVYYAWAGNHDNNIFGLANTSFGYDETIKEQYAVDKTTANYLLVYRKKALNSYEEVGSITGLETITDISLAKVSNKRILAIITDNDCDITTSVGEDGTVDRAISFIDLETPFPTENNLSRSVITNNDAEITEYMGFTYSDEKLYLAASGDLYELTYIDGKIGVVNEKIFENVVGDYQFVYDIEGNLYGILTIIFESSNSSNIYFAPYEKNDSIFGDFVKITNLSVSQMIESYDYYWENGNLMLNYVYSNNKSSNLDGSEENLDNGKSSVESTFVLYDEKFVKNNDLILVDATLDSCEIEHSTTTKNNNQTEIKIIATFTVQIKNDSIKSLSYVYISLLDLNNQVVSKQLIHFKDSEGNLKNLLGGLTNIFTITFEIVGKVEDFSNGYVLKVESDELVENSSDLINNELLDASGAKVIFEIARADISITVDYVIVGGIKYINLMVQNIGVLNVAKGKIYIDNNILDFENVEEFKKTHLYELEFENLMPNTFRYYTIELNKIYFTEQFVTIGTYGIIDESSYNQQYMNEYKLSNNGISVEIEKADEIIEKHTVTYIIRNYPNAENGIYEYKEIYMVGEKIKYLDDAQFIIDGYTFSGWLEKNQYVYMPDYDITVYAYYTINGCTITYLIFNNGHWEELYKDNFEYGTIAYLREEPMKEGYTFKGWAYDDNLSQLVTNTSFEITASINLYGKYEINSYAVHYYVDNEEVYVQENIVFGNSIPKYNYTKEGYDFSGWNEKLDKMPAHDIYVYGSTTPKIYYIRYEVEYNNNKQMIFEQRIPYGVEINSTYVYNQVGFTFDGWYYNAKNDSIYNGRKITNFSDLVEGETFTMPATNITMTGKLSLASYNVYYYVDGKLVNTQSVLYSQPIPDYSYTAESGEVISKWLNLPKGNMPAQDLYVQASTNTITYDITYYIDGEIYAVQSVAYDEVIHFNEGNVKEGYTFISWKLTDTEDREITLVDNLMPAYNIKAIAQYKINSYLIDWIVNGSEVYSQSVEYNSTITPYVYNVPEGYTFSGWDNVPEKMPAYNLTIYGNIVANIYKLSYYVNEICIETFDIAYGMNILEYKYLVPEGYKFNGWEQQIPQTMPAHNVDIYGSTSKNEYTITYYVNGEIITSIQYEFEEKVLPYEYVAPVGYTFEGFLYEPDIMPAHDVNVYGNTKVNSYNIYYYIGNDLVDQATYVYGSHIEPKTGMEKEGYTFAWSEIPQTMPAHDLTITGEYIKNQYNIYYYIDGLLAYTDQSYYGDEIIVRKLEQRKGYTFSGWTIINDTKTMPSKDVYIHGIFTANKYLVTYYLGNNIYKTELYEYGSTIDLPEIVIDNQKIVGWELNGKKVDSLIIDDSDINLVAITQTIHQPIYKELWFKIILISGGSALLIGIILLTVFLTKKHTRIEEELD